MNISEWIKLLFQNATEISLLQWLGVIFGIIQVLLAKANKILLYPFGIISVLITIYIFYSAGLYAEVLLNIYYLVMSIYGWWFWHSRKKEQAVPITYANLHEWFITITIVLLGTPLLYFALAYFTDSIVPLWDAWISATAWAGMWLLAKRKIENWILLNVSNAFAIPLLIHKSLPLYAILTLILFIVAVFGYFDWKAIVGKRTDKIVPE